MERSLKNAPATISQTFYEDGNPTDPGTVTVTVTRADGTPVVNAAPTTGSGAAARSFVLSAANASLLDSLTFAWASPTKGTLYSLVEIVGDFQFALTEIGSDPEVLELPSASRTPAKLAEARTIAEQAFEEAASRRLTYGIAYVPRYHYGKLSGAGGPVLSLPRRPVRAIRSVAQALTPGAAATVLGTSGLAVTDDGIYRPSYWTAGPKNYTIGYEYGLDRPSERVKRAVLTLAKNWLIEGPITDRATSIPAGDAGGVITLATPGLRDSEFGIPEVDAALPPQASAIYSVPLAPAHNVW